MALSKQVATVALSAVGAYGVHAGAQYLDTQIPTGNIWTKPSTLLSLIGGLGLIGHAAYGHPSENVRLAEAGAGAYFLTKIIDIARTALVSQPMRFRSVPQAMSPTTMAPVGVGQPIF